MKIQLARLEARLQALIEGSAARLFSSAYKQNDLAFLLVEAMSTKIETRQDGENLAPNLYTLTVHPEQAQLFGQDEGLIERLTAVLRETGAEGGLLFVSPPVVRVEADPGIRPGEVRVLAENSLDNLPQTSDMEVEPWESSEEAAYGLPQNAYLIVNGMDIFALNQPVINIGRRRDNQLVINDPRISRVHAQIRAMRGHYVIFDLDSTGGTFVNGERVRQSRLYPGDVISLSGVPLVFGQDPAGLGETQKFLQ